MAAQLKGNLGLKSSPLAPTACKLSTQYLVLDHMTNHYNKIAKAKSAIDSKPPKSLSTSQKLRDRRNRNKIAKSPRSRPMTSMSQEGFQVNQDLFNDEPEDEEDRLVYSIMKSTLLDKDSTTAPATTTINAGDPRRSPYLSQHHQDGYGHGTYSARPGSARSIRSGHSLGPTTHLLHGTTTPDPAKVTYQGDVLEKRPYLFTAPERPFTPRTLKNNHQSRLKNSKCYNPPPHKSVSQQQAAGSIRSQPAPEVRSGPRPQPRSRARQGQPEPGYDPEERGRGGGYTQTLGDTLETTGQLSESMLMDITLQSRDGRHRQQRSRSGAGAGGQDVPPLAISMDEDHMNWLQEQASKAQVRARSTAQLKASSLHSDQEAGLHNGEGGVEGEQNLPRDNDLRESIKQEALQNKPKLSRYRSFEWVPVPASESRSVVSCSSWTSWVSQCLQQEDEDQKYLAFAKEVTDDVLSRRICTDSVLHRVFENHIERKKDQLDEDRMRQVIHDLRRDLGLRDSSAERTPHAALSSRSRNHVAMAPVTVVTNGEDVGGTTNGSSSTTHQQHSGSSKATTTGSTSAKDESSSSVSPAVQYRKLMGSGVKGTTSTTLEPLQVMSSPSENGVNGLMSSATMESVSSFKFGQTGDMVDTITSEVIQEDTAREREEAEWEKTRSERDGTEDGDDGDVDELTATQALKQYEFDLTVKEGTAEVSGNSVREDSEGTVHSTTSSSSKRRLRQREAAARRSSKQERPATGERRQEDHEDVEDGGRGEMDRKSDTSSTWEWAGSESSQRQRRRQQASDTQSSHTITSDNKISNGTAASGDQQVSGTNNDDTASVKSSASSQVPKVRPRTKLGQKTEEVEDARHSESGENKEGDEERPVSAEAQSKEEDYEDDYEEDEEGDVDESTHRTSDDDF